MWLAGWLGDSVRSASAVLAACPSVDSILSSRDLFLIIKHRIGLLLLQVSDSSPSALQQPEISPAVLSKVNNNALQCTSQIIGSGFGGEGIPLGIPRGSKVEYIIGAYRALDRSGVSRRNVGPWGAPA